MTTTTTTISPPAVAAEPLRTLAWQRVLDDLSPHDRAVALMLAYRRPGASITALDREIYGRVRRLVDSEAAFLRGLV